jgi:ATP-dependent Clp protease adaptor protein ClpS
VIQDASERYDALGRGIRIFKLPMIDYGLSTRGGMIAISTTTPNTERRRRTVQEILPPYSVILHNDDHHAMDYVVAALVKSVPGLTVEEAVKIMLETHNTGQAVMITCPLEQAELHRDRIRSFGLGVTIEKA